MKEPRNCIPVSEAEQMQKKWMETRDVFIKDAMGATDANNVTFSLSDLEAFLEYAKNKSNTEGIENPGIRVYFAANGTGERSKATVFLSATCGSESTDDDNKSIMPFNRGNNGFPPRIY